MFLVPKEKLKTHDDESDKNETPNKKRTKTKNVKSIPKIQDYNFKDFRKLCMNLSQENSYTQKTAIIKEFFDKTLPKGMYIKSFKIYFC